MTAELADDFPEWAMHVGPWTEEEFFALPATVWPRVELIDGSLLVTPGPGSRHQEWAARLRNELEASAPHDVRVLEGVNIRMMSRRVRIPDVTVTAEQGDITYFDPRHVALVAEVVSPGAEAMDKQNKAAHYAEAQIPWYLLVEQDDDGEPRLLLWKLDGMRYAEVAVAESGHRLDLPTPMTGALEPGSLTRRSR